MEPQPLHTNTNATTRIPNSSCVGLIRRLTWTIVLLFLLLTVIIAIAWSVMDPHKPRFRVSTISVSNFSVSDSDLKGVFEVELNITNPNKKVEIRVDQFYVWVSYSSVGLSRAILPQPIYLKKRSDKGVKIKFSLKNSSITKLADNKVLWNDLVKDWSKGIVNFDVKMMARIVYEAGILPSREKFLDIYCGNLDVGFVPIKDTGKLLGIGKDCHAEI
ncbi:NDR1/HIN1-like protein 1 [Vicia villosa]|uniref:NDR1/HIN1-like protein 1 n=1 Tax=Vicia villosa TaxID=3911 RepID=UPI00273A97C3|nr:NDR1/HIN1-like protein 1 [Vicia villosa]